MCAKPNIFSSHKKLVFWRQCKLGYAQKLLILGIYR